MKQTLNMRQQLSINLRDCYWARRATQNMSTNRSSPTIVRVFKQYSVCKKVV